MRKYLLNLFVISAIIVTVNVGADTLNPTDDTYVAEQNPGSNHGGETFLMLGHSAYLLNTLIKFDLSTYTGEDINSAELRLYVYYIGTSTGQLIARNTSDWSEGSVTWSTKPATADEYSISAPTTEDVYWIIDVTALVQGFLDGTYENYGFQMTKDTPLDGFLYAYSKEYTSIPNPPELEIVLQSGIESASFGEIKAAFC